MTGAERPLDPERRPHAARQVVQAPGVVAERGPVDARERGRLAREPGFFFGFGGFGGGLGRDELDRGRAANVAGLVPLVEVVGGGRAGEQEHDERRRRRGAPPHLGRYPSECAPFFRPSSTRAASRASGRAAGGGGACRRGRAAQVELLDGRADEADAEAQPRRSLRGRSPRQRRRRLTVTSIGGGPGAGATSPAAASARPGALPVRPRSGRGGRHPAPPRRASRSSVFSPWPKRLRHPLAADEQRHRRALREPEPNGRLVAEAVLGLRVERGRRRARPNIRRLGLVRLETVGHLAPARVGRARRQLAEERDHVVVVVERRLVPAERVERPVARVEARRAGRARRAVSRFASASAAGVAGRSAA